MRKNIYVKDEFVIKALEEAINASELIEVAIRYYLGLETKEYVELYKQAQEVNNLLKRQKNKP